MTDDRRAAVGRILAAAAELTRQVRRMRSSPFAGQSLSGRQVDALFVLARSGSGMTPSALAAALGVTAGAVTQLVDPLADSGLIERREHPTDARSRLLALSEGARARVEEFEAVVRAQLAARFDGLDDTELARLADAVTRVTADD